MFCPERSNSSCQNPIREIQIHLFGIDLQLESSYTGINMSFSGLLTHHECKIIFITNWGKSWILLRMYLRAAVREGQGSIGSETEHESKLKQSSSSDCSVFSYMHISKDHTAGNPNKVIVQRAPFSKVNMSDIKNLFWSEMNLNLNAAPSTTYFCSLLQDKLIKDQWELYVYFVCLLRLEGTSANVMHLYQQ